MNKKYLFGMLVSGAMLAACTAEDDLNLAKVNKDVNPEAPVFVVSFEDEDLQNRAIYTNNQVNYQPNDLLSLYHGSKADATSGVASFTGYGNAVYKGKSSGEQFIFSTEAMVKSGKAIMVYPADTTGVWEGDVDASTGAGLFIRVPEKQPKGFAEKTPYMSEFLTIKAYPSTGVGDSTLDDQAGYHRQYDINLRRAAGTILMSLNRHGVLVMPEGVDPIDYRSVTLGAAVENNAGAKLFTSKIEVKVGEDATKPVAYKMDSDPAKCKHLSWLNQSRLDVENAEAGYSEIVTEDITDGVARFTILPAKDGEKADRGYVTVQTRYGFIKMEGAGTNRWWTDKIPEDLRFTRSTNPPYDGDSASIGAGLRTFFKSVAYADATSGTYYKDANNAEKVGKFMNVGLYVDMEKLNMNDLHIKDAKHLRDAIAVFNANFDKKVKNASGQDVVNAVRFILEGNDEGKFVMDKTTWETVVAQLTKNASTTKNSSIAFAPCDEEGKVCKAVVLDNKNEATEVPALQFAAHESNGTTSVRSYDGLNLELKGKNWTYTSTTWSSNNNQNNAKNIDGIKEIHVLKDADLTPSGYVTVKNAVNAPTLVIDEDGKMTVKGKVYFQLDVTNKGVINIDEEGKGELLMTESNNTGRVLTNWADDKQTNSSGTQTNNGLDDKHKYGVINNGYALGVRDGDTNLGTINNYGYIKVMNDEARTFVSTNASVGATFSETYAKEISSVANKIGVIELTKPNGNRKVSFAENANKGFVKCTIKTTATTGIPTYADFGGEFCVANYFVLDSSVKQVEYKTTGTQDTPTCLPTNAGIYVETNHNLKLDGKFGLEGLIVKNNALVDVLDGTATQVSVDVKRFYLQGTVYAAGKLTDGNNGNDYKQSGYYGTTTGDISGPGTNPRP